MVHSLTLNAILTHLYTQLLFLAVCLSMLLLLLAFVTIYLIDILLTSDMSRHDIILLMRAYLVYYLICHVIKWYVKSLSWCDILCHIIWDDILCDFAVKTVQNDRIKFNLLHSYSSYSSLSFPSFHTLKIKIIGDPELKIRTIRDFVEVQKDSGRSAYHVQYFRNKNDKKNNTLNWFWNE